MGILFQPASELRADSDDPGRSVWPGDLCVTNSASGSDRFDIRGVTQGSEFATGDIQQGELACAVLEESDEQIAGGDLLVFCIAQHPETETEIILDRAQSP